MSKNKQNKNDKPSKFMICGTHKCFIHRVYDGDTVYAYIPILLKTYDYEIKNNTITSIIDKNTINNNDVNIYDLSIRLYGIDTPEMKPKLNIENRNEIIKKAITAKEFLENMILNKDVFIKFVGLDKYGRYLGVIYDYDVYKSLKISPLDDNNDNNYCMSVNKKMLLGGFAVEYFGGTKKIN